MRPRRAWTLTALAVLGLLLAAALLAPEGLPDAQPERAYLGPLDAPPFGTDQRGVALWIFAAQGARIIVGPALAAGLFVGLAAVAGGLVRCTGGRFAALSVAAAGELVGSLPRMLVVLVTALVLPWTWRGLLPLGLVWALLSAPGAMDEAGAVAARLGGARFVEALRAHGFGWARVYLWHVVALNLRPVVVRQAAETFMQVGFLEMALSYLSLQDNQSGFTHPESLHSWAELLQLGYPSLVLDVPTGHALALGLGAAGLLTLFARAATAAAAAR